jgi:hypothetical protein
VTRKTSLTLFLSVSLLACLTAGCAQTHELAAREIFDEHSGTTLLVVRRPIVLARSRSDAAANVRDYITLVVMREDRSGKYSTWLVAYRWSTLDTRFDTTPAVEPGRLLLIGDGRSITLSPVERAPTFLQQGNRPFAPHFARNTWAYAADLSTLRYLATARELSLRLQDDPLPLAYTIWEDGRAQLLGLIDNSGP